MEENRFGFEPEISVKPARKRDVRIYEVPISTGTELLSQALEKRDEILFLLLA